MIRLIILLLITGNSLFGYSQRLKPIDQTVAHKCITGTWKLVSVENIYPDGSKIYPYGNQPAGLLMFDETGNYTLQIFKAVRMTVASGDKNKSTPEENAALVQGSNSHFGKYSVNEADHTITFNIANASFPNWNSSSQKRSYSLTGSQFKYLVTQTTQGGKSVVAEVTWEREK